MTKTVAVLGTGIMGSGMARNLIAAGLDVTVWNRSPDRARALADAGARMTTDAAEAVAGAEVVVTMLFDLAAVEQVMEWASHWDDELTAEQRHELRDALRDEVLADDEIEYDEAHARRLLEQFSWNGYRPSDAWEWDFTVYEHHFLWLCWAVVWAIREYDETKAAA